MQTISVTVRGDDDVEDDETVVLTLGGATNAELATSTVGGTIVNDDAPPPALDYIQGATFGVRGAVGVGQDVLIGARDLVAGALVTNDMVVHLTAFAKMFPAWAAPSAADTSDAADADEAGWDMAWTTPPTGPGPVAASAAPACMFPADTPL